MLPERLLLVSVAQLLHAQHEGLPVRVQVIHDDLRLEDLDPFVLNRAALPEEPEEGVALREEVDIEQVLSDPFHKHFVVAFLSEMLSLSS